MSDVKEKFEAVDDEYGKFDRVENKLSERPDLHAFILLDQLFPGISDIVCAAEHDEIFLDITESDARKISDSHVLELVRCGVRYNSEFRCLCMFV